jgi:Rab-GTPase-TBC domain
MNFIAGRLRKFLSEEETFWVFTMIVESYLPFDYFAMMVGVLIDQKMFMKFVQCEFKNMFKKFNQLGFDPSILAFQWFVCIFSYNMPEQVTNSNNYYFIDITPHSRLIYAKKD